MADYRPMRQLPPLAGYQPGDFLVVCGELFQRGYVNGVIEAAQKLGMKVVYATVGRRTEEGALRPLTTEEMASAGQPLINVPLEAGFDLEPSATGPAPVEQLADYKLQDWQQVQLNWQQIEESYQYGSERFKLSLQTYLTELDSIIEEGRNVVIVHTMAGGIPRSKLIMALMNRVFKGRGARALGSAELWNSPIGRLCQKSFKAVTAETFGHLIDESQALRERIEKSGGRVRYLAYGYHGCEALIGDEYRWMTYTPYLQGEAKIALENIAKAAVQKNIRATVYNCPEILTNSSSIFQGVELCLYALLKALKKEQPDHPVTEKAWAAATALLKPEHSVEEILKVVDDYACDPRIQQVCQFAQWPQHSHPQQLEFMLDQSQRLQSLHRDGSQLATVHLSELIFASTGRLMLNDSWQSTQPVWWLNHDIIAKELTQ